jgi:hypothetical protein
VTVDVVEVVLKVRARFSKLMMMITLVLPDHQRIDLSDSIYILVSDVNSTLEITHQTTSVYGVFPSSDLTADLPLSNTAW